MRKSTYSENFKSFAQKLWFWRTNCHLFLGHPVCVVTFDSENASKCVFLYLNKKLENFLSFKMRKFIWGCNLLLSVNFTVFVKTFDVRVCVTSSSHYAIEYSTH